MDKAQRDSTARKMLDSLREDGIIDSADIADAFFAFLDSAVEHADILPFIVGYLGYGVEYLRATGAEIPHPKARPVHQWLGRCPACADCHTDLSEVARLNS